MLRTSVLFMAIAMFVVSSAPPASADLLDDILEIVKDARKNAADARDNAKDAEKASGNAVNAAKDATAVATEIRDYVNVGVAALTNDLRQLIAEAAEEAASIVHEEMQARDAFLDSSEPEAFRSDVVMLLQECEDLVNNLAIATPDATPAVSFAAAIEVIENLPARGLWPLYGGFRTVGPLSTGLLPQLQDANLSLEILMPLLHDADDQDTGVGADGTGALDYELGLPYNQTILLNVARVSRAATKTRNAALALKMVGSALCAAGKQGVFDEVEVQIHGYIGSRIKSDFKTQIGLMLNGAADNLARVSATAKAMARHAMIVGSLQELRTLFTGGGNGEAILENQEMILANQEAILANQATILESLGNLPWEHGKAKGKD